MFSFSEHCRLIFQRVVVPCILSLEQECSARCVEGWSRRITTGLKSWAGLHGESWVSLRYGMRRFLKNSLLQRKTRIFHLLSKLAGHNECCQSYSSEPLLVYSHASSWFNVCILDQWWDLASLHDCWLFGWSPWESYCIYLYNIILHCPSAWLFDIQLRVC